MVSYKLELVSSFEKDLRQLPKTTILRVLKQIVSLQEEPRPPQAKKLSGSENSYRVRVGDYRILYTVDEEAEVVGVFAVDHRRDIYKQ